MSSLRQNHSRPPSAVHTLDHWNWPLLPVGEVTDQLNLIRATGQNPKSLFFATRRCHEENRFAPRVHRERLTYNKKSAARGSLSPPWFRPDPATQGSQARFKSVRMTQVVGCASVAVSPKAWRIIPNNSSFETGLCNSPTAPAATACSRL